MTWTVRLLRSAEHAIAQAMEWYGEQLAGLDQRFLTAIDEAIEIIRRSPASFALRIRDYRSVLVRRFPYIIYYRIVSMKFGSRPYFINVAERKQEIAACQPVASRAAVKARRVV